MHHYLFKFNKEKGQIELGDTGKVVARKDSPDSRMFNPDVDPSIGAKLALHVISGLYRRHSIRFGEGDMVAHQLTQDEFPLSETLNKGSEKQTIAYSEYSNTIRVEETNHLLMKRRGDEWIFDFDSGAPEQLVQQAYLRFYQNPELKHAEPAQLVEALSGGRGRELESQALSM